MNTEENKELLEVMLEEDENTLADVKIYNKTIEEIDPYNNPEALNAYGYVYEIRNNINGKSYIGCRMIARDNNDWEKYYGSGSAIKKAISKYGRDNFTKLLVCYGASEEELFKLEWAVIRTAKRNNSGGEYNIFNGSGAGGNTFQFLSDSEMEQIRLKQSHGIRNSNAYKLARSNQIIKNKNKADEIWDRYKEQIISEYKAIGSIHKINRYGLSSKRLNQYFKDNNIELNHRNIKGKVSKKFTIKQANTLKNYYSNVEKIDNNLYNCIACLNPFYTNNTNTKYCKNCQLNFKKLKSVNNVSQYYNELDGTYIFTNICLVCSHEYDTFVYSTIKCNKCINKNINRQHKFYLAYDELYDYYITRDMTIDQIANILGCKYRTVYNLLKKHSIRPKNS